MKNKKGYKIFNFVMKIISWCVMSILCVIGAFLIAYIVINKIAQAQGKTPPLGLYTIISGSMVPEIDVYDVVVVMKKNPEDIQIGDIISYQSTNKARFDGIPITHRVVEKFNTNNGVSFRTKGDANAVVDNEIVMGSDVVGTVRFVIPQLGRIQFFLASKGGWFFAILVPALAIIIYDIIKLVKLMAVKKKMESARKLERSKNIIRENENPRFNSRRTIERDIDRKSRISPERTRQRPNSNQYQSRSDSYRKTSKRK